MWDRFRPCATAPPGRPSNRRRSSAGFCGVSCGGPNSGPAIWRAPAPSPGCSGDADELELDVERFAVEGLHHIFVGARFQGGTDMRHVILGGAKHDLGLVAVAALAEQAQELHAAHYRHVPIE